MRQIRDEGIKRNKPKKRNRISLTSFAHCALWFLAGVVVGIQLNGLYSLTSQKSLSDDITICRRCCDLGFYTSIQTGTETETETETENKSNKKIENKNGKSEKIAIKSSLLPCQNTTWKETLSAMNLPSTISTFAHHAIRTSKDDFIKKFDYGMPDNLPGDKKDEHSKDVLLIYPKQKNDAISHSKKYEDVSKYDSNSESSLIPFVELHNATSACDDIVTVYVRPMHTGKYPCVALIGGGRGVHHLLRYKKNKGSNEDGDTNFERSGLKGRFMRVPDQKMQKQHNTYIYRILNALDSTLDKLQPILQLVQKRNTVTIMCLNKAYVPLLMNHVCSSRARRLDLSSLLIFATDMEVHNASVHLGLHSFYTGEILGKGMPTQHSSRIGDETFQLMTYGGVVCTMLVNMLGYDVLFQDADVIHFKNVLDFFLDSHVSDYDYDILFMDDGNDVWDFQPFRPNSGFYFVRHNDRTRYFLRSFVFSGDLVSTSGVDQIVMSVLANEHSARHGLKIKTLDHSDFPGGFHYNRDPSFTQRVINGETTTPWIFHMHWTDNKITKIKYFKQSGMWYLKEECIEERKIADKSISLVDACCTLQPSISCYYENKPHVQQCQNMSWV